MAGGTELTDEIEALFARPADEGVSLAVVVLQHGEIVAERYGVRPGNLFEPEPTPVTAATALISWSIAKSMAQAALAVLAGDGLVRTSDAAPVPEWRGTDREAITILDLLEMRSGLGFVEDYVDGETSDVIDMLFGTGAADHAAFAAAKPLVHPPGTTWSYSSGTTNILSRIMGDLVAGGADADPATRESAIREFLDQRLLAPLGLTDAELRFDDAGNWVASSYVHLTGRQFARFGELYLRDGRVGERQLLPPGTVDDARTVVAHDPETGFDYGRHWWVWPDQPGSLGAHGYEGQYVVVLPAHDAVVVHLGKTDAVVRDRLAARLRRVIAAL